MRQADIETPEVVLSEHDAPMSGVSERVEWLAARLADGLLSVGVDEWSENTSGWRDPARGLERIRATLRGGEPVLVASIDIDAVDATILCERGGRRFEVLVTVDPDAPHGITGIGVSTVTPPEVTVRRLDAVRDVGVLVGLEASTPIELSDGTRVTIDLRDDLAARYAFVEDAHVLAAYVDGEPAACRSDFPRPVRVHDGEFVLAYAGRVRTDPRFQGRGLGPHLMGHARLAVYSRCDGSDAIVHRDNERMQHLMRAAGSWDAHVVSVTIDCATLAGGPGGRAATDADVDHVAPIIADSRRSHALAPIVDADALTRRWQRVPSHYGPDRVAVSDDAIVGHWGGAAHLRVETSDGTVTTIRQSHLLDLACRPGATSELERLLRGTCARAADEGIDELTAFTCLGTDEASVLVPLATRVDDYDYFVRDTEGPSAGVVSIDAALVW